VDGERENGCQNAENEAIEAGNGEEHLKIKAGQKKTNLAMPETEPKTPKTNLESSKTDPEILKTDLEMPKTD
jgi:hypothetical protein